MIRTTVRDLCAHYERYYDEPGLAIWRDLGAFDKATTIARLTQGLFTTPPRVVEIGCGDGAVLAALSARASARELVGFDISPSGVKAARGREYRLPTRVEIFDGERLPVQDDEFDLAVLTHVIEHVENPRELISEAARVASRIFVEVPLELNARTPRDFRWTDVGHINLFNPTSLRHLIQSVGLRVERECVVTSSRAVQRYMRPGLRGDLRWLLKLAMLKASTRVATSLLTYNGALVAIRS